MISRRKLLYGAGALALCALLALAKGKPPGTPGGGGDDNLTGTVYLTVYDSGRALHEMDPDGSNMTDLGLRNDVGEPSHAFHGDQRWFLVAHAVPGSGSSKPEIYAYAEDGSRAQLTNQALLRPINPGAPGMGAMRWSPDDSEISFLAQEWDGNGNVVAEGIYSAVVTYGSNGDVTGLTAQPSAALVAGSGIASHDWSPDGDQIVFAAGGQISIFDLTTEESAELTTGARPAWSPDGSLIAFERGWQGIYTISPAGSGETRILRSKTTRGPIYGVPCWSPASSHLICLGWYDEPGVNDVYRIAADGRDKTLLTGDVATDTRPVAWR